ncbi:MAG: GNAT family N-acetyltransferase [Caldisericia bacterium]|nr:GNAT family N-acetyltransferase [Caldisericia bacterium]
MSEAITETLKGDTGYYAIGNNLEHKFGANLIFNTDFKVWSCNMARDLDDATDIDSIIKFFEDKGIDFCRAFALTTQENLLNKLTAKGFRQTSSQIGFWIDRYEPVIDPVFSFTLVDDDASKKTYLELHKLEALEHNTPAEIVDSIGQQRLDKNKDSHMKWFLVNREGKLAGSVGILLLDNSARIKNPYTLPEFRGKGIGANACHFVNKLAFENGAKGISVYAQPNSGGFKLYTKMGFGQVLEHKILMRP